MKAAERRLVVRSALEARDRAPLDHWHFAVPRLREAFRLYHSDQPITELHLRACNKGTKTETEAAFALALAQKRPHLDGVTLPYWRGPVEIAQLVLDYKQQALSVQPAYERMLGKWPHHPRRNGGILESLAIMPVNGSADESTWSVIHFLSQKNLLSGTGVRADAVIFDEPPVISILQELRKAAHAGRRSIRLIGETPTLRRQWQPLRDEYGDCARSTLQRVNTIWAECRWSLHEVANWVLSPAEKEELLIEYGRDRKKRDPLYDARVYGDYCDTSGACPFDVETLLEMRSECWEPEPIHWPIRDEGPESMHEMRLWECEQFLKPEQGESYWMTIDPSSGVDDDLHDPFELEIGKVGSGDLVFRTGGYLPGRLVGILGAGLCRQYNAAVADFETNDRWGVNVMEGFHAAGYGKFAKERRQLSPTKWIDEPGFHNTAQTRPQIIGAVQSWVESWKAGNRYAVCPSKFIINTLLDCIMNPEGKIEAAPGVHDEALICWGQMLRKTVRRSGKLMPEIFTPPKTDHELLMAKLQGKHDLQAPFGQRARKPLSRSRI